MSEQADWQIVFYIGHKGESPVEEFIESLDYKTQKRLSWSIDQLRLRNTQARAPLVKHVEGKLWELREESGKNIYRIIYFFFTGRQIILLHGFQKKTQKLPRQELEIARKYMEDFLQRQGDE